MLSSLSLCPPELSRNQTPNPQPPVKCTLTKHGQRFLTKLATTGDAIATKKLIRKFVESSPKSVALSTLSHLLSPATTQPHLSSLALPLYARIREASWFNWNPNIVAELAAMLDKLERFEESETLVAEATSKLESRKRDLALFYCKLTESYSKRGSEKGFEIAYSYLSHLLHSTSSVYIKRRVFEHMVSGLCAMGRPREAEDLVENMRTNKGIEPSAFELRSIMYGYGRLGSFEDLQRIVDQMEKAEFAIDTVCSNMVLSTYGIYGEHRIMVSWLQKMKNLGIPLSVRTYNSVLNSCPTITSMLLNSNSFPVSLKDLLNAGLEGDEAMVVGELVKSSSILEELMGWDPLEAKLDLHGLHLGSSYLILLLWLEEMQRRMHNSNYEIPAEVVVVCGSGKHSNVRGESPVRNLVKEITVKTRSPLRIDRKNNGCFVAKGRAVKDWLSPRESQASLDKTTIDTCRISHCQMLGT